MITMEKGPRSRVFPRWPSPITRPGPTPVPRPRPVPKAEVSTRARVTELRRQGWTVWFGRHTRQCWAAHTTLMRLVCADTLGELIHSATSITGQQGTAFPSESPWQR